MAKKFNARNIWACVCEFFATIWDYIVYGAKILWAIIKAIVEFVLFALVVVIRCIFVYNPIMFPIWVLLGYRKSPADVLFKDEDEFHIELFNALPQAFCAWEVYCFPWFMKRDFVRAYPQKFSHQDQIKMALEIHPDEKKEFIEKLDDETRDLLWKRDNYSCNLAISSLKSSLDVDVLKFLLQNNELETIKRFCKKTPSTECIEELIASSSVKCLHNTATEVLYYIALKHGLNAAMIEALYHENDADTISVVEKALVRRNQYQMVVKLSNNGPVNQMLWERFCQENIDIWVGAQKMMSYWMMETYYATGHNLSDSALVYFLSAEDDHREEIAKIIFANEEKFCGKVMSVIRSIPDVYSVYMQTKNNG